MDVKQEHPYSSCLKDPNSFQKDKTIIQYIQKQNESYSRVSICITLKKIHAIEKIVRLETFGLIAGFGMKQETQTAAHIFIKLVFMKRI